MRTALASLDLKWLDKEKNFSNCKKTTKEAVNNGCDLIIFPEMTLTGFSPSNGLVNFQRKIILILSLVLV